MSNFHYALDDCVVITLSDTPGVVKGRTEYSNGSPNMYNVHHISGEGNAVYSWVEEQDLS